jgi:DNA-binding PadR family transcriptional regulator
LEFSANTILLGRVLKTRKPLSLSAMDEDILLCLSNRSLYGLEILEKINQGRPIQLKFSSIYPALDRGCDKGFLEWYWGDDESGGGRRKYFRVTDFGKRSLKLWMDYRERLGNDQNYK